MELQPLGDVILKLLDFALYEREGALQRVIREAGELENIRCLPGLQLDVCMLLTNEVYNTSDAVLPCI